ncbi:hypothetical protein K1T71_009407 [Dendrolimus kikuchii]|uniref:Uncharacterized protein n=1 Tax=Dendrolimus kikuchii TaxID=765133 RepID=A0ACC1CUL9_9NEOP|nr:hypothetical protein K1T71_009407 [Dendrolimus kikuchii]
MGRRMLAEASRTFSCRFSFLHAYPSTHFHLVYRLHCFTQLTENRVVLSPSFSYKFMFVVDLAMSSTSFGFKRTLGSFIQLFPFGTFTSEDFTKEAARLPQFLNIANVPNTKKNIKDLSMPSNKCTPSSSIDSKQLFSNLDSFDSQQKMSGIASRPLINFSMFRVAYK